MKRFYQRVSKNEGAPMIGMMQQASFPVDKKKLVKC